ncbi:MAG TPA: GNAT family N-acetyltransferase [Gemmataceae bacterium]|nr:GNAT family N-acetyltransferase [Gemmataceae bacterium]
MDAVAESHVHSPRRSPDWSVVVARSVPELAPHIAAWEVLAAAALEPNVFYEPWMLLPALDLFGPAGGLRVVLVFGPHPIQPTQRVLAGVFPLHHKRYKRLPISVLTLWQHAYILLGTPLLRADCAPECLQALFRWLGSHASGCPLVEFQAVSGDGRFAQRLTDYLHASDAMTMSSECSTRALFRRRATSADFLEAAFSREQRKTLRRREKRLAEAGRIDYARLEPGDDLDRWLVDFLQVEASGWKGQQRTALASHAADCAFFTRVAQAAFTRNRLGLFALRLDGRPIALQCYFQGGDGAFFFKTAYDETYARFSPGILLQVALIHRLHETRAVQWVDSCSLPQSYLNELWPERRIVQNVVVATGLGSGEFCLGLLPLLRWLKRTLLRRQPGFRRRPP